MNEHDPLEAELAALKPHEPAPQLRERIADHLSHQDYVPARWRWSQAWWSGALTGGLVAACLAAGVLLLRPALNKNQEIESPPSAGQLPLAAAFDDALPTVWTYQRAMSRSPRDVETLLDKHAAVAPSTARFAPRHLFIDSDVQLLLQGEL